MAAENRSNSSRIRRLPGRRGEDCLSAGEPRCSSIRHLRGEFPPQPQGGLRPASGTCRTVLRVLFFAVLTAVGCRDPEPIESVASDEQSLSVRLTHEIHHIFGDVVSVAVDSDGRVFLADNLVLTVWAADANGEVVDSVGRRGGGPGEFDALDNIQWMSDTLYTFDASLQRLTAFPLSGERGGSSSHRTVTFRGHRGVLSAWVSPTDRSVIYSAAPPVVRAWEITQGQTTVHRVPATARVVETHPDEALLLPVDERLITVRPGRSGMTEPMPFGRSSIIRVGPDGMVYHLWTGEPRIRVYDPDGSLLDEIPLPGDLGRPVTQVAIDDLLASIAQFEGLSERSRNLAIGRIESARAEDRLPSHWPVATDFVIDDRGRLWIALVMPSDVIRWTNIGGRRYSYASPSGEGRHLVMIDRKGGTSRHGLLATEGQIVAVRGDRMYILTTDSLGVQFVKVFTIDGEDSRSAS